MTIAHNISIHPVFIFLFIISMFTGMFVQFFIVSMIVCIHELGHVIAAKYYKWDIPTVSFHFFGGVMETTEWMNRPINECMIVTIAGPIQHAFIFLFLNIVALFPIVPASLLLEIHYFNLLLCVFNLLPIMPLDGGRMLFYIVLKKLPYYFSYQLIVIFSLFLLAFLYVMYYYMYNFHLTVLLLTIFLFLENVRLFRERHFQFLRFLMQKKRINERRKVIYCQREDHIKKLIKNLYKEKQTQFHIIDETIVGEREIRDAFFDSRGYHMTIYQWLKIKR